MSDLEEQFAAEVDALRQSGVLGERGRVLDLFNYLASRGPHASNSPSEQVLAAEVFGRRDFSSGDDASVRVYMHRLRKKLDEFYSNAGKGHACRLSLPRGEYRLLLETLDNTEARPATSRFVPWFALGLVIVNILIWLILAQGTKEQSNPELNAVWQTLGQSSRPVTVLVGDYYLYAEKDDDLEVNRLVRDYRVNSPTDLERLARAAPQRYGKGADAGLSYLPPSAAYALGDILPRLVQTGRPFRVAPVSSENINVFKTSDVVYVGLLSGMSFLESMAFANSSFVPGDSYDEIIAIENGQWFRSTEAMGLMEQTAYRDYGYFSFIRPDTSGWLMVIAGTRDTGLRGIAELVSAANLPVDFNTITQRPRFEALVEVGGQQQSNIRQTLISTH